MGLATKLRALYQRKKGRDLFDLWFAIDQDLIDADILLTCFNRYMHEGGHAVSRAQFEANLHEKADRPDFRGDIGPLLRSGIIPDFETAMTTVLERLIHQIPGESWKGTGP